MTPVDGELQSVEEVYKLLRKAAARMQSVSAVYDDLPRLLCPHVLGRNKEGRLHALCCQSGGRSRSGLDQKPEGGGVWRCLAVEKLSCVALAAGHWRTEPRANQQHCVVQIDFDSDAQPGDEPQNGQ